VFQSQIPASYVWWFVDSMNSSCIYYILQKELLILKSSSTGQLSRMGPQLVVFNVFFFGSKHDGVTPNSKVMTGWLVIYGDFSSFAIK
jgi:hypothetical protein